MARTPRLVAATQHPVIKPVGRHKSRAVLGPELLLAAEYRSRAVKAGVQTVVEEAFISMEVMPVP